MEPEPPRPAGTEERLRAGQSTHDGPDDGQGAHPIGVCFGHRERRRCTEIQADHMRRIQRQRVEQSGLIPGQIDGLVAAFGTLRVTSAAQVRRHDLVASGSQSRLDFAPNFFRVRESMQQQDCFADPGPVAR